MGYKFSIEYGVNNGINAQAFDNFMTNIGPNSYATFFDLDNYLKPYGARNIDGTPYIEFETEKQATLFILRWT